MNLYSRMKEIFWIENILNIRLKLVLRQFCMYKQIIIEYMCNHRNKIIFQMVRVFVK